MAWCILRKERIILRSDATFPERIGDQGEFVKKSASRRRASACG